MLRDLSFGFRLIRRAPGMALTAALTLALGIAATSALVSVVYAVLVNPLPFPDSRRLVQVWRSELPALTYGSASFPRYLDWRANQRPFTDLGAWAPRGMTLAGPEGPERVSGATASAAYFTVVGRPPLLGRWFTEEEDRRGGSRLAVIGEGLWRRRFGGAASAIGRDIQIDGELYTIVGVAPASFAEVWRYDVWIPLGLVADPANRGTNYLLSLGRLREGMTLDAARRQMSELAAQMSREHGDDKYTFTVREVHDVVTEGASRGLWVLLGATVLLLLIGCTNVANLLLARAVARERDLAVRASLGAGRRQLVSQVLGETIALGLVGSVAGAALAWALLRTFVGMAPPNFPRLAAITLDLRVLALTAFIGVTAGVIAGLLPAVHLFRSDLNAASHGGATRGATARRARSAGRMLVVSEIALALALLTTAGVMVKSLLRLQDVDLGLTREPLLTFAVSLPPFVADGEDAIARFQTEFLRRVRALPGVTRASAINMLPVAATGNNGIVRRPDQIGDGEGVPVTEVRAVMDGYTEAMGVRLLAGRAIDERDGKGAPPVALINRTLAARLWPTLSPAQVIGQPLRAPFDSGNTLREVIGVVADVRSRRPDMPPDPELHAPFAQVPLPTLTYVVRGEGDPTRLTTPIRTAARRDDSARGAGRGPDLRRGRRHRNANLEPALMAERALRPAGGRPGRGRYLRTDVLHGGPARARAGRARSRGREPAVAAGADRARGARAERRGHRGGHPDRVGDLRRDRQPALRGDRHRCHRLRPGRRRARRRRVRWLRRSRDAGVARGSGGCTASRMTQLHLTSQ